MERQESLNALSGDAERKFDKPRPSTSKRGPKGLKAHREAAAKRKTIQVQPSAPVRHLTYKDDFFNGLDLVVKKAADDNAITQEVAQFMSDRAAIERDYAKALSKLAQNTRAKASFKDVPTWNRLLPILEYQAVHVQEAADRTINEIHTLMVKYISETEVAMKEKARLAKKLTKDRADAVAYVEDRKKKYDKLAKEHEILNTAFEASKAANAADKKLEKMQKGVQDAWANFEKAEAKYKSAGQTADEVMQSLEVLLQEYEAMELGRANWAVNWTDVYCNIAIDRASKIKQNVCDTQMALAHTNVRDPMVKFIKSHTVAPKPQPFAFEGHVQGQLSEKEQKLVGKKTLKETKKKGPPPKTFGVSIVELMERQAESHPDLDVPLAMKLLCDKVIELGGLTQEGIFRVPGSVDQVNELRAQIDSGMTSLDGLTTDVHSVAGALKLFLREQPEPLLPVQLYEKCILDNTEDEAFELMAQCPPENQAALDHILDFLCQFARPENASKSRMDADNLAMVFAPSFLRNPTDDMLKMMENVGCEKRFVLLLLSTRLREVIAEGAAASA